MTKVRIIAGCAIVAPVLIMLPACNEAQPGAKPGAGRADCAIGDHAKWTRTCTAERDGDILTLRHAEGGFRRFHIVNDGRGLVPADGAEQAEVKVLGKDGIEVSVGDDRYRLPATLASAAP